MLHWATIVVYNGLSYKKKMLLFIGRVQEISNLTLYEMSTVDAIMAFTAAIQETQYWCLWDKYKPETLEKQLQVWAYHPMWKTKSTNCIGTEIKVFMNNRDSKWVNVPGMFTDVAQTCYGLFPAIFVVYFIYEAYMFSKLAVVILLLFCSFSIADNLCNYQLLSIDISSGFHLSHTHRFTYAILMKFVCASINI